EKHPRTALPERHGDVGDQAALAHAALAAGDGDGAHGGTREIHGMVTGVLVRAAAAATHELERGSGDERTANGGRVACRGHGHSAPAERSRAFSGVRRSTAPTNSQ